MKKIYRLMQIIVVSFLYHVCPKKSNSSNSFKEKISGSHKCANISLAILLQSLKITHKKITSFHLYKHKAIISKQINKKEK